MGDGAARIVERLRRGEVSAREVVAAHIGRIEAVDPAINAVVVRRFDEALEEAAAIDAAAARGRSAGQPRRPLEGLPVTVKECFDIVGLPTTAGVVGLPRPQPTRDATVVARLRRAGVVVLGKTNLAQLSWALETDNPVYGRTNNPFDRSRTPGGSSGGEGAIVAAGGSPVGLGTDSGGSVRIPAHFCGVHGLKPTSRRLSDRGTVDKDAFSFQSVVVNQPGLLARRVEDLRLVYGVLTSGPRPDAGRPDAGRPDTGPPDAGRRAGGRPGDRQVGAAGVLRVGYFVDNGVSIPSTEVADAVIRAAEALEGAGAEVLQFSPPGIAEAMEIFDRVFEVDAGATLRRLLASSPRSRDALLVLEAMPQQPCSPTEVALLEHRARGTRRRFAARVATSRIDVIICPPAPTPAPAHGGMSRLDNPGSYTALFNLLGWPSGVVTVGLYDVPPATPAPSRGGHTVKLPVGVQVAARPFREDLVLLVMEELETALAGDLAPTLPHLPLEEDAT